MFLPRGYIPGKTLVEELIDGTTLFTQLNVDNIRVDGNTISSVNSNGDINLSPNGSGNTNIVSGDLKLGGTTRISNAGVGTFASANISVMALSKPSDYVQIINTTGSSLVRLYDNGKAQIASASAQNVVIQASSGGVINHYGSIVPASTNSYDLGSATYKLKDAYFAGNIIIGNINISGNTISSTDANGDVNIDPNGTGNINLVSGDLKFGGTTRLTNTGTATLTSINSPDIAAILNCINYQYCYDWSALPNASAFPWTKFSSGSPTEAVAGGVLTVTDPDSSSSLYYTRETSNIAQDDTVICSTSMKIDSGPNKVMIAAIGDNVKIATLSADSSGVYYRDSGGSYVQLSLTPSTSSYQKYTLLKNGQNNTYIFINDVLYATIPYSGILTSGGAQYIFFGSTVTANVVTASYQYFRYAISKEGSRNIAGTSAQIDSINIDDVTVKNNATNGSINLESSGSGNVNLNAGTSGEIIAKGKLNPQADNTYSLGKSGYRWTEVWATNGTIQTSDARNKTDVISTDLGLDFINNLQPVSFRWQEGKRRHYGIVAQNVEHVLDGKDFAGLIRDIETGEYGLRYHEFISPLIKAVQELNEKVEKYENTRLVNILKRLILRIMKKL